MRILMYIPLLAFCFASSGAAGHAHSQVQSSRSNWSCNSAGYVFRWSSRDVTAANAKTGKIVYSVAGALKKEFGKPGPETVVTHYEVSFAPVSVVGPYLSYQREDTWDGGAHSSGNERFVVVDVRDPGRRVKLTDLFPAESVRTALLADKVIQRVLRREGIAPPATLSALVKALANQQFGGDDDFKYIFPSNLLENFAFHHIEKGKVAVRFILPHGSEIYRFQNTQIGILLPVPSSLRTAVSQAAAKKSGSLMHTLQRSAGDRRTTLVLYDKPAR